MPFARWSLKNDRPAIEITLTDASGQKKTRTLLADTGAGDAQDQFDLVLHMLDCAQHGGVFTQSISVSGAFVGSHPAFEILVEIPLLGYRELVVAVGVPYLPPDFDGIACFRFLNRFTYGNFGDKNAFGLET